MSEGLPRRGISVFAGSIDEMVASAAAADAASFHSVWTSELYNRSATVPLAAIAQRTDTCAIGSGIMYGVGRTPVTLASEARDLDELSAGRLILGLGNGTRRMIADWHGLDGEAPATRMEELVPLLRSLWRLNEGPVEHEGRFYHCSISALDQMTEPPVRDIPIFTAGVNPRMMETAGRVADGLIGHTLFSPQYIEEVARPALERGADRAGRDPQGVSFIAMVLCSIADDEQVARREAAGMIAFYASVRSYANIFEVSGFGAQSETIRDAFRRRDVAGMLAAVTDEMVDTFAVAGRPDDVKARMRRYDSLADQVVLFPPSFDVGPDRRADNLSLLIEHGVSGS